MRKGPKAVLFRVLEMRHAQQQSESDEGKRRGPLTHTNTVSFMFDMTIANFSKPLDFIFWTWLVSFESCHNLNRNHVFICRLKFGFDGKA